MRDEEIARRQKKHEKAHERRHNPDTRDGVLASDAANRQMHRDRLNDSDEDVRDEEVARREGLSKWTHERRYDPDTRDDVPATAAASRQRQSDNVADEKAAEARDTNLSLEITNL